LRKEEIIMAIDPISALGASVAALASVRQQGTTPRDIEAAAVRRQNRNDPASGIASADKAANTNIVDSLTQTRSQVSQAQSRLNGRSLVTEADINRAGVDANGEEFRAIKLINASVPQQPQELEQTGSVQEQENIVESAEELLQQADEPQTLAQRIAAGRQEIDATTATEQPENNLNAAAETDNLQQAQNTGETLTATQQETIDDRLNESATVQTSADIAERNTALTPAQEQGIKAYERVQNYGSDPLSLSNAASAA
jgi:hypothetical protein